MEKKASPLLLAVPVLLILAIVVLIFLIVTSLNKAPTVVTASPETNNQQAGASSQADPTRPPQRIDPVQAEKDKAMNAVPQRGFPDNTCPGYLVIESSGNKFALQGENKFLITDTQATWIQSNCSDTETLNF